MARRLLGPSGCGKTTLFHVIAGLERPSAGRVLLGERDVTGCPGQLSYMLQKDLLLPSKTILDNVSLPLVLRGMPRGAAREPTRIVGAERIDRPRSKRQDFNLTEDFLAHKRRVLALPGERTPHRSPRKRARSAKNTRYSPASHFSELSQKRFTRPL